MPGTARCMLTAPERDSPVLAVYVKQAEKHNAKQPSVWRKQGK